MSIAQEQETFTYNGQENQEVTLVETKEVTLYRTQMQDSTCTRQIPYTEEVCGNETFYRNECHWVPGRNHCYDDSDYVCRNVTRQRRECTRGRSREECTNEPARRVCRTRNGVERCVDVPGRRRCRQVQGPERCRNVNYTDRVCDTVTRRQCDWISGQNECSQVPYQEWVCRDVTRYRNEQYSCKVPVQIPYKVDKEFRSTIQFKFNDLDQLGSSNITVTRDSNQEIVVTFENLNSKSYIQLINKTVDDVSDSNELQVKNYSLEYNFGSLKKLLGPLKVNLKSLWMNKAGAFSLKLEDAQLLKDTSIQIKVNKKSSDSIYFKRLFELKDFRAKENSLNIDLSKHGFERIKGLFGKGVKIKTEVKLILKRPSGIITELPTKMSKAKSFSLKVFKNK
jgi:hypothetical protein